VAKRPQDWTAAEKLDAVLEASRLGEAELGEFLRTRGLHREHIEQWRSAAEGGLARPGQVSPEARRVRELEKELRRKEKALAEAAALLVLKKKVEAIWGDEDDDTEPKSGK
jgi:transposase-like protein